MACAQAPIERQATPAEPVILKIESNLVLVSVVVRDSHGNPVTGLKKEDFRLFDQGKQQSIAQFEEESPATVASTSPSSARQPAASASAPAHFIALYFDNLNTSEAELIRARDAADRTFAASLGPGNQVAVFTADSLLSDFTSDPKQIHGALLRLHLSVQAPAQERLCPDLSVYQSLELIQSNDLDGNAWRAAWEESKTCAIRSFTTPQDMSSPRPDQRSMIAIRALAQRVLERARSLEQANLQQIELVIKLVGGAPGDRSVIVVSPGFTTGNGLPQLDRIINRALRAQVVIDALNPEGLAVHARESDVTRSSSAVADPQASQARYNLDAAQAFASGGVLADFAQGTGGKFFHDDNDLRSGFSGLTDRPSRYVLAFVPKDNKLDGKFHSIKVALVEKHNGATIAARRGYFAISAQSEPPQAAQNRPSSVSSTLPQSSSTPPQAPQAPTTMRPAMPEQSTAARGAQPVHLHMGVNSVSVGQVEELLAADNGKSDGEIARQLSNLELVERLSSARLSRLQTKLPGAESTQALLALGDASVFLNSPADEIPAEPIPDPATQAKWLKAAVLYAAGTLTALPDIFATRDVSTFADSPAQQHFGVFTQYQPLHYVDQSTATVLYRQGEEVSNSEGREKANLEALAPGLITSGEFGPILGMVLRDAAKSSISWSHWEQGVSGHLAVFRYSVPREKSHYQVRFCCIVQGEGLYQEVSAYHGEIAVEPESGTIMRITLQAAFKQAYPVARADILVEYGPTEIGGKTYTCPSKGVAIAVAHMQTKRTGDLDSQVGTQGYGPGNMRGMLSNSTNQNDSPLQTLVNDTAFVQYHMFRSDARVLPPNGSASEP